MTTWIRTLTASAAATAVLGGGAAAAMQPSHAKPTHCAQWTSSGPIGNGTGQSVVISVSRGHVATPHLGPTGSTPFTITLPGSVSRVVVVVAMASADYSGGAHPVSGWRLTRDMIVDRPASC